MLAKVFVFVQIRDGYWIWISMCDSVCNMDVVLCFSLTIFVLVTESKMLTFVIMENRKKEIYHLIDCKDIGSAISMLYNEVYTDSTSFEQQLNELKGVYHSLLSFYADGLKDPNRPEMIHFLQCKLLTLTDAIFRQRESRSSADLYYSKLRVYLGVSSNSLSDLLSRSQLQIEDRPAYERIIQTAFEMVWTSSFLSDDDKNAIDTLPEDEQALLISALCLGRKEWWCTSDIQYLLSKLIDPATPQKVLARIYVELVLIFKVHPLHASLFKKELEGVFSAVSDTSNIVSLMQLVYKSFYMSMTTERMTEGMQRKLRKSMENMDVDISKLGSIEDLNSLLEKSGEQPEWKNRMESSGELEKTLREFNELQEEGMDMMHSSFMNLKTDFFFRNVSNWFIPFSMDHSRIRRICEDIPVAKEMGPLFTRELCDSDRFSFFFMLESLPAAAKSQMLDGFAGSLDQLSREMPDFIKQTQGGKLDIEIRSYIKGLYRFYKLYDLKSEFTDVFKTPLPFNLPLIGSLVSDYDFRVMLADVMISHEFYDLAIPILKDLCHEFKHAALYEKMGYALQKEKDYVSAMKFYKRADVLSNGEPSQWLYKQMAFCARQEGDLQKAYEIFMEMYELKMDSRAILLAGSCLLDLQRYGEAAKIFEQYMFEADRRDLFCLRPLAWCAFKEHHPDKALSLYEEICSTGKADASDYLNAGHCYFILSQVKKAVSMYRNSLSLKGNDTKAFVTMFKKDYRDLKSYGLKEADLSLMCDAVVFPLDLI